MPNSRTELEEHDDNAKNSSCRTSASVAPLSDALLDSLLNIIVEYKDNVDQRLILPGQLDESRPGQNRRQGCRQVSEEKTTDAVTDATRVFSHLKFRDESWAGRRYGR